MLPPVTTWPPNRLTPSICGLESRPLRELPTPFLWAIALYLDRGDADGRRRLPMTAVAPVVLAPFEFHDEPLAPAPLPDDFAGHACRADLRAGQDLAVPVHHQHGLELDRRTLVAGEFLDRDHLPGRDPILLAASCNHRFHGCPD